MESKRQPRGRPATGKALSAAERMRRYRARKKSAGLRDVRHWTSASDMADGDYFSSHRLLEARSLALHCLIARRISADPSLLDVARCNLDRWRIQAGQPAPHYLREWQQVLALPWPGIAAFITEQSDRAVRLRQSSPFAGVLTASERRRIYDAFGA